MTPMRSLTTLSIAAMLAAGSLTGAMAQTFTATNSASAGGSEGSSTHSLAAESASNPTDAGFGQFDVVDFANVTAPTSGTSVSSLTLTLTAFSGKYSQPGPLDFFLSSNTTPLTGTGSEGYTYQGDGATDGIGTQLGTLTSLGTLPSGALAPASPVVTAPVTFNFALTPAQQAVVAGDLAAGDLKIALGVSAGATTATDYDGAAYSPTTSPTLALTTSAPVPEASTTVSFGLLLALGGFAAARRRKVA